ncbi:MAG TPA: membrane protein insertase YidC [Candidatus Dormibacteraeota bacterium]|nr:membrane protein insertase YidC [Candidatus Dormibacteraeota bacterium]
MAEYRNPQQEPGSERRLLVIFLISFVFMLLAQPLLKKYFPTPPPPQQSSQPAQTQTQAQTPPPPPASKSARPAVPSAPVVTRQAASETETVIESDLYRITFTNRGAQVKSWILKKFDDDSGKGQLDLVNTATAAQFGYPLSLWTYDEELRGKLNSALYEVSRDGNQVTFEYSDQDLDVRKKFQFDNSYVAGIEARVTYKGSPKEALPAWPAGFGDQTSPAFYASTILAYQYNKNIQRVPARCGFSLFSKCTQVIGGGTMPGPFHWVGPTDQYFAAVFIPDDPAATSVVTLNHPFAIPKDSQKPDPKDTVNVDVIGAAVGNLHGTTSERLFAGPKELQVLQKISVPGVSGADNDLNGLVDFGWWGIIAKPLFVWLRWTYHYIVPNWGWAIIVQTIILSLALMPLRITQMKSMLKMQRVAPQIKSIQEKYKKYSLRDPRKAAMNEEISALYKKEGVNPAGGCLPMLIQFPFLIAYYRMLGTALDLRHAHFLWIHDLSAAEPFPYILPVLMVLSSLINQKMTPQAGMDPAQQRMMNVMMPLMMGFIFFRLQAGLNLYYAMSNLIMIAQQSVMNRTHLGREMREMMAKRARKKDK